MCTVSDVVDANVRISLIGGKVVLRCVHARISSERASGVRIKKCRPQSDGSWRTLHYAASGRSPYHRALQVGWSRFRAVLMLCKV
jgi:hypothetical protein